MLTPVLAQQNSDEPTNEKAQKTYKEALEALHKDGKGPALEDFKRADKQDGGHCKACQEQMVKIGIEVGEWKTAQLAAEEMVTEAQGDRETAIAHHQLAVVLMNQGTNEHKEELFVRAHEELTKALAAFSGFPDALLLDGKALAHMKQDDAAKVRFEEFVKLARPDDPNRQRAMRYIGNPDLARARMAPAFAVTTMDGKRITMDDLQGKVVLLDFWATWCGPCREALPHMLKIAKKFEGQPLVILSVSLDTDDTKWRGFVAQNNMTWLHYRDGYFTGPVARLFGVNSIPHTFSIDADGVLQDEHVGDASIEGKLNKLLAHARELQSAQNIPLKNP
jgi:thiol-disulfide isomerase/thioredoxin